MLATFLVIVTVIKYLMRSNLKEGLFGLRVKGDRAHRGGEDVVRGGTVAAGVCICHASAAHSLEEQEIESGKEITKPALNHTLPPAG